MCSCQNPTRGVAVHSQEESHKYEVSPQEPVCPTSGTPALGTYTEGLNSQNIQL